MISGYTSINEIIAKLYRDLGINTEINELSLIEWAAEALELIGAYGQYNEVSECLELNKGKAKLPIGFHKLVDISYKNRPVYWATNTNANNYQCEECFIPVCVDNDRQTTFYLNDSYVVTSLNEEETSHICIVYLGIPVDENNYPLVPDDVYYRKAIAAYITNRIDYQEWRKGKVADKVYQQSEKDWLFYVNSAKGSANMPNVAQLENLKNIWTRLAPLRNEYSRGFKNIASREKLNLNSRKWR